VIVVGVRQMRRYVRALICRMRTDSALKTTADARLRARRVPEAPRTWRSYPAIAVLFGGPADPAWGFDRSGVDDRSTPTERFTP